MDSAAQLSLFDWISPVVELRKKPGRKKKITTTRDCLTCDEPFESDGSHNRICHVCKMTQAWRAAEDDQFSGNRRVGYARL